jgi:cutinase
MVASGPRGASVILYCGVVTGRGSPVLRVAVRALVVGASLLTGLASVAHARSVGVELGRWQGSAKGGAKVVFTVEASASGRRYVVRPMVYCDSQRVSYWETSLFTLSQPDAWPISRGGALENHNTPYLPPPLGGRFSRTRASITFSASTCAGNDLHVEAHHVPAAPAVTDGQFNVALAPHDHGLIGEVADIFTRGEGALVDSDWGVYAGADCFFFHSGVELLIGADGSFTGTASSTHPPGNIGVTISVAGRFTSSTTAHGMYVLSGASCEGSPVSFTVTLGQAYQPPRPVTGGVLHRAPAPVAQLRDPGRCAKVRVIGVRGSGEDPNSDREMGELPYALAQALTQRLPGVRVTGEGLDYPAVGIVPGSANFNPVGYGDSVSRGVRALPALMRKRHGDCPKERWVLAAYSQGAQVLGDVLAKRPPGSRQVVAVVLWADPKFSPKSPSDRGGAKGWGILNGPLRHNAERPPRSWTSRTESWCNPVDIVCQGVGINHTVGAHLTYQNWALSPAESFAADKVRAAFRRR